MTRFSAMLFVFVVLFGCLNTAHGARILGIFPSASFSHQMPLQMIMKGLVAKGHQVTVISPNPLMVPVENYTDIDLSKSYELIAEMDFNSWEDTEPIESLSLMNELSFFMTDYQLGTPQVQALIKSNDTTFDLVVIEQLMYNAFHGLVHHFGSPPMVAALSFGGMAVSHDYMGNPNNPAYCPDIFTSYSDHMTFWQRFYNAYVMMRLRYNWRYEILPGQELLLRKYFGSAPPSVYETYYNNSLLILANHWSLSYLRPLLPNVVEVTGLHIETTTKPLPKDIQSFLDGAQHGVIYFSLGSNVKSKNLPEEKVKHILQAFSKVPQRVVWKWESETLPGKPDNVMIRKWLPQQDVLGHPNIKVFITQGGLQSFQEAAYYGVPLIGIPFLGDQVYNVVKFEAAGIGLRLRFKDVTTETLLNTLDKVLNDSRFQDNMKIFSAAYREEVHTSLDKAVWWIEYVLRHNGAHHLRSAALDLAWYQYLLLDVIAVLFLGIITTTVMIFIAIRKLISFSKRLVHPFKDKIN